MRNPSAFNRPLAVGAPPPQSEVPARPYRMIHFFPPQNEKVRAKIPELIPQVDVLLGNLEDAIPAADKKAARGGPHRGRAEVTTSARRPSGRASTASTARGSSMTS